MWLVTLQSGGGILGSAAGAAVVAGTLVLGLALVALGAAAYKHVLGDGIQWPDDVEEADDADVSHGNSDDEWKYY
ncbi:hypothetical protein [Salinigranum sp. GCM10025319]|uniref:hypothetical protein n=1 Tax=Salinigranum sp. GCM10025319 TaxID=3252687 RepID=UPI00360794D2